MNRHLGWVLSLTFLVGCASYQGKVREARLHLSNGENQAALQILEAQANEEGRDQVIYLLDYALALHQAKEYKKSSDSFILADKLAEWKDYISLSRQAGSLLLSERMTKYRLERFENLLINVYLALNFTVQGQLDEALVECRRIDEKFNKMRMDGEAKEKNFLARYLSAMIWEAQGKWDSAYIDYKNAYDIDGSFEFLPEDLIRSAWRARRYEAMKKWQKMWPQVKLESLKKKSREQGELVFVFQQGWIPRKRPHYEDHRFPTLARVPSGIRKAYMEVDGKAYNRTSSMYDVGDQAIEMMKREYSYLVAKKIAGFVAKEVVADQIGQKNKGLGALALIAMHVADQADLRQWSTLPESFQVSRVSLPPGEHTVKLYGLGPEGKTEMKEMKVTIKKGKKTFITHRTFH